MPLSRIKEVGKRARYQWWGSAAERVRFCFCRNCPRSQDSQRLGIFFPKLPTRSPHVRMLSHQASQVTPVERIDVLAHHLPH